MACFAVNYFEELCSADELSEIPAQLLAQRESLLENHEVSLAIEGISARMHADEARRISHADSLLPYFDISGSSPLQLRDMGERLIALAPYSKAVKDLLQSALHKLRELAIEPQWRRRKRGRADFARFE